jgi:exonuclease III
MLHLGSVAACAALIFVFALTSAVNVRLSIVSWNVNGVSKFGYLPKERDFVREHDVVFLQETFSRPDTVLDLAGFRSHHALARCSTGPKNFWGLSTFFKRATFVEGFIKREFAPCDWILISRWMRGGGQPGIIFFNIYIPAHTSGIAPGEVFTLTTCVNDMLLRYPGDKFILGGDFNLDQLRFHGQRFKPPMLKLVFGYVML